MNMDGMTLEQIIYQMNVGQLLMIILNTINVRGGFVDERY